MGSLHKVSKVARDVLWKARNGSIDCIYTYDEFVMAVNRLGNEKGNPPVEMEHQNPAPPLAESLTPMGRHSARLISGVQDHDEIFDFEEMNDVLDDEQKEREKELNKHTISRLKELCKERDERHSGTKKELIARLLQERKPEILITRARHKQYIPKIPSCNAAILVAILLHNKPGGTMKKEDIMNFAQETGISKDPMFGNGKSWYDGEFIIERTAISSPSINYLKNNILHFTKKLGWSGIKVSTYATICFN